MSEMANGTGAKGYRPLVVKHMNIAFIVTIDTSSVDPQSLLATADDIHSTLEGAYEVVDVKPWARPSAGLPPVEPTQPTGVPPVSGTL